MCAEVMLVIFSLIWMWTRLKQRFAIRQPSSMLIDSRKPWINKWKSFEHIFLFFLFCSGVSIFRLTIVITVLEPLLFLTRLSRRSPQWSSSVGITIYQVCRRSLCLFLARNRLFSYFFRRDVLQQQLRSLLSCELFESFSILQLSHKGQVQVILFPDFLFSILLSVCFWFRLILIVNFSGGKSHLLTPKTVRLPILPTDIPDVVSSSSCWW